MTKILDKKMKVCKPSSAAKTNKSLANGDVIPRKLDVLSEKDVKKYRTLCNLVEEQCHVWPFVFPSDGTDAGEPPELPPNVRKLIDWKTRARREEKYNIYRMLGEDPAKMIVEIRPFKKGGEYKFPFGGGMIFPEGAASKRDVLTVCCVSPSERQKYLPKLRRDEFLVSEIILMAASARPFKKEILFRLPYHGKIGEMSDLDVLWRKTAKDAWESIEYVFPPNTSNLVEVRAVSTSMFCVIHRPRHEKFTIPASGLLHNTHIHHQISVRVPKKAMHTDVECEVQIVHVPHNILEELRKQHPFEMGDLITTSEIVEVTTVPVVKEFKWAVTVKVPLPHAQEEYQHDDIFILKFDERTKHWDIHEGPLKFGKASVMFDTHHLGRFCVALMKHGGLKARALYAMQRVTERQGLLKGVVMTFLYLQESIWTVLVEVVQLDEVESVRALRLSQGFTLLPQAVSAVPQPDPPRKKSMSFKKGKEPHPPSPTPNELEEIDLRDGDCFQIEMEGDLEIDLGGMVRDEPHFYYCRYLSKNYKKLFLDPVKNDFIFELEKCKTLRCFLKLFRDRRDQPEHKDVIGYHNVEISTERVARVLYVPPEEEEEPAPVAKEVESVKGSKVTPRLGAPSQDTRIKRFSDETARRLSQPARPPRQILREAKVLSGKSLQVLARIISHGLTLAIHLHISDSSITGLGFDALSNGYSVYDITYRMLLYWKRRAGGSQNEQVTALAAALVEMGELDAAQLLMTCHRDNREMTTADFDAIKEEEDDDAKSEAAEVSQRLSIYGPGAGPPRAIPQAFRASLDYVARQSLIEAHGVGISGVDQPGTSAQEDDAPTTSAQDHDVPSTSAQDTSAVGTADPVPRPSVVPLLMSRKSLAKPRDSEHRGVLQTTIAKFDPPPQPPGPGKRYY